MKIKYVMSVVLVLFFISGQCLNANQIKKQNNSDSGLLLKAGVLEREVQSTQSTEHSKSDSLPEGFTDDKMKDLRDENGKKIFSGQIINPGEEGDAFQQRIFAGSGAGDKYGNSVSAAGDVNGDGYDDLIIGAYSNDASGSDAGRAYIYYGGMIVNSIADVTLSGEAASNYFGYAVSYAGDVNGDGFSDVIVGAWGNSSNKGKAYIYLGGSVMNNVADIIMSGEAGGNYFGIAVSSSGDVNGDGYSDISVGAYGYNSNTGRAYIFYGGVNMDNVTDITFTGEATNNYFGASVSSAGDLNSDGYSDFIVGAYGYISNTGKAYVYFGGSSMDDIADLTMTGAATLNKFGVSVSTAEDVNGDGYSDMVIGAPGFGSNLGRAYIYFGGSSMDNAEDIIITGEAGNNVGNSVSSAGDVNGDTYSDVLIGKYGFSSFKGRASVYFGGASMNNIADIDMTGDLTSDQFGVSVSKAGDMNGDGYSDLIVGAVLSSSTGKAYLYMYGMNGIFTYDLSISGTGAFPYLGISVSSAGDVNGDGYDDIIVGAPNGVGVGYTGDAYIYFGGALMDNIADVSLAGEAADNRFGNSVSNAGDVNGDGYSDVIVGAFRYSSQRGRAYIFYGGAAMNSTADVIMTGDAPSYNFGSSVSFAGDVNADGYSDVIIGADAYNVSTGLAYIYLGGAVMNNVSDVTMTGENINNYFGCSVSSAGDVNGDGYSDIVVGAYGNNTNKGKVYLYYGGGSMDNVADITMAGLTTDEKLGNSVSSAGDVNGDGYSDILTGAYGYNNNMGRAYVFYGGSTMDNSSDVTLTSEIATISFGNSVSDAGDINNDGFSDVIVGAYESTGLAYIYFGGSTMNGTSDVAMKSEGINTYFGSSVSTAGDLNGDGYPDLIIGAPLTNNYSGKCFIYITSSPNVYPNILSVKDVPDDQGGYVNLKFARSAFDVSQSEVGGIYYQIERSIPPAGNGIYHWISTGTVGGIHNPFYTSEIHTPLDSSNSGNNTYFFRVTAISNSSGAIWRSNILSGYSIDNLIPLPPANLMAAQSGNSVNLNWNQNSENDLRQYIIYRNGIQIGTSLTLYFTDNLFSADSAFIYRIAAEDIHGNISGLSNPANVNIISATINIKVIPEGFYISSSDQLNIPDTVRAYLHSNVSPFNVVDSAISVIDANTFSGSFKFLNAPTDTYYIVIKHRNTIETWSKSGGEAFITATNMYYDFTLNSAQAFGSNMVQVNSSPVRFAIFSGDVNQDGIIDAGDLSQVENDASNSLSGYESSDVTGDDFVDAGDLSIVENNAGLGISTITP